MPENKSIATQFWNIASELRAKKNYITLLDITQEALARGIKLTTEDLNTLAKREPERSEFFTPAFISKFIASYLRDSDNLQLTSLLDVWAGIGGMSAPIIQEFQPSKAIALEGNYESLQVGTLLQDASQLEWRYGNPEQSLDELEETFDVIVGNLPFGMRSSEHSLKVGQKNVIVRDELGRILVLKACRLLNEDGVGFFTTSPSFLYQDKPRGARQSLNDLGLFLEAVLTLPAGWLSPITSLSGLLLVIRKRESNSVFLAELTDDPNSQATVLKNLQQHHNGNLLQHGVWVDSSSVLSLEQLVKKKEIEKLGKAYPFPWKKITDFATIVLAKQNQQFQDVPNAVYLPMLGSSPATTSIDDLWVKPQNVVQLRLDPDRAIASYFANFLNSTLGRAIRESGYAGFIPRLTKKRLSHLKLPLPNTTTQGNILSLHVELDEITSQAEKLQRNLWDQPARHSQIQKSLKSIGKEDNFDDWIETLPFPLASILWTYHADNNPDHKVAHLLHFFEALSQFRVTVILSAYEADKAFYAQELGKCIKNDPQYREWYKMSTFGGWNVFGSCLASKTRTLLEDSKKGPHCLRLFANVSSVFTDALLNKKLTNTLIEVADYRNNWKGHGGITSKKEIKDRLRLLEISLSKTRQTLSESFTLVDLIAPGHNLYSEGIYDYTAKSLRGTRTPFREVTFDSKTRLDHKKMYLRPIDSYEAIKLLPFFRIMQSPKTEQNACYFYNRLQGDEVRWVSYHFESEAEIIRPDSELQEALSLFEIDDFKVQ